jgi:hypothetical protein
MENSLLARKRLRFWTGNLPAEMKENVKYQESCAAIGHGNWAMVWSLSCFCLLFVTLRGFANPGGIIVKGNLNFNGNGVVVDSFNSSVPGQNVNGLYDPSVAGDDGQIFAGLTVSSSVSIGNANVYGFIYTAPTASVSVGVSGAVGTHAWIAAGGTGIEPGHSFNDANIALPDVSVPSGLPYQTPGSGQVVTPDGPPTNQAFTNQMNLPTLSSNQTLVSITTNTFNITTSNYPGPVPGLTTNFNMTTSSSYPGDVPGLTTNCFSFVTVTTDPGPQPCLSDEVSNVITADYPGPLPGLVTNTIIAPPCISVVTNFVCSDLISSSTLPDTWCAANGVITNCVITTTPSPPALDAVCPGTEITTNFLHGIPRNYTYSSFSGYTYSTNTTNVTITYSTNYNCFTTNYTYSYPITNFTYANQVSYTYQIVTYIYPQVASYNYTIYMPWTYQTNYYDNVLSGGNYFASSALPGNTIVTGPSILVMSNFGGNIAVAPGGSLTIYVQGGSCSININQTTNRTGMASNLVILCTPSVNFMTISGAGSFAGVVYAPEATASVNGGSRGLDFSGALAVNALTGLGHLRMHYDEALSLSNPPPILPPPQPMTLFSPGITTNGQFQFAGVVTPGYNWVVETSTDLMNWTPIFTFTNTGVVTDTNAIPFLFTDTNGISPGQCFYRTVYVQ